MVVNVSNTMSPIHINFVDGSSRWSSNIASTHLDRVCVSTTTNKQAEYDAMIGILNATLHLGIPHFNVFLDSHMLVSQLNNLY